MGLGYSGIGHRVYVVFFFFCGEGSVVSGSGCTCAFTSPYSSSVS